MLFDLLALRSDFRKNIHSEIDRNDVVSSVFDCTQTPTEQKS